MDNDRFKPPAPAEPQPDNPKLYAEPPVKDYSFMVDNTAKAPKAKHGRRNIIIIATLIVILAAGGWLLFKPTAKPKVTVKTTVSSTNTAKPKATPTVQTQNYNSQNFNLSLNYPVGWTVVGDTPTLLSIESPAMPLTAANGQKVTGKVIMNVQPQGQLPAAFGTADATAVLTSQRISYAAPTTDQRAQTYLSFVQYAATTTTGGLDGIYITADYGYQKDQTIPRTDIAGLDPLVTVTFGSCSTTACTSLSNLSIQASQWNNPSFQAPILTLLESLAFG